MREITRDALYFYHSRQDEITVKQAAEAFGVHPQTLYKQIAVKSPLKKLLRQFDAAVLDPSTPHLELVELFKRIIEARG